eukprot:276067_1
MYVAEIDVCSDTQPNNPGCTDSVILGCTHIEPTGYSVDNNVPQAPGSGIVGSSHMAVNRAQTEYILDEIFNDDLLTTLGIEDNADNIQGVFLGGDLNTGQLFDRCTYAPEPDDCRDGNDVLLDNIFDSFADGDMIDAPDVKYKEDPVYDPDVVCTYCLDDSQTDFNDLSPDESNAFINDASTTRDVDHILVQDGYCGNFKALSFERIFMDKIVTLDGYTNPVPMSDHYGVALEIEFKNNKGGRKLLGGKCAKN